MYKYIYTHNYLKKYIIDIPSCQFTYGIYFNGFIMFHIYSTFVLFCFANFAHVSFHTGAFVSRSKGIVYLIFIVTTR